MGAAGLRNGLSRSVSSPQIRMKDNQRGADLRLEFFVEGTPSEVFPTLVQRFVDGLERAGIHVELRVGGTVRERGTVFGVVEAWRPDRELLFSLRPATWTDSPGGTAQLAVESAEGRSRVTLEVRNWRQSLGALGARLEDWLEAAVLPALSQQLAPRAFTEWFVDHQARKPAGESAVATYRDPTYHWPNFLLILDRIALLPSDRLLEVACGGGAFLRKALESGCTATGVDYSPEMVRLTLEANRSSVDEGRLTALRGEADALPVDDQSYTVCVCTGAFNFFPDPSRALREMFRVLRPGGRLAIFTDTAAARGTPAAPEPFASQSRFYEPAELARLAEAEGFTDITTDDPNLGPYAKRAGLAPEVASFFDGTGGSLLLLAKKS